jgi:hypothetical protein
LEQIDRQHVAIERWQKSRFLRKWGFLGGPLAVETRKYAGVCGHLLPMGLPRWANLATKRTTGFDPPSPFWLQRGKPAFTAAVAADKTARQAHFDRFLFFPNSAYMLLN